MWQGISFLTLASIIFISAYVHFFLNNKIGCRYWHWCIATYIYICNYTHIRVENINNNNDERTQFFKKIYLSHFIRKGWESFMCERWVGDWTNCNILIPSSFVFSSTSFSFCWTAQSGILRAHSPLLGVGSRYSILSLTRLTPTEPICRTRLYNCLTLTCFLWTSHLHPIQPIHSQGYTLISSTGCTCFSIDGWVEGQYVTVLLWC